MIVLTLLLALTIEIYFKPRFDYLKSQRLLLIFYSAKSENGAKIRKRLIFEI
jgi:hypothetical protein